jgi:hypothetical protein
MANDSIFVFVESTPNSHAPFSAREATLYLNGDRGIAVSDPFEAAAYPLISYVLRLLM